ncbi:hypothetical protein [Streptomyces sp. NPDC048516]|uniref:hypothetical protein n=1 Tax=Streptomyces sp. NPDC048516 TaxID=3365565 RepID=UPI0037203349
MLCRHLEYLQRRGATLPGDPALVASAISSMLLQFSCVWLVADGRAPGGTAEAKRPTDDEAIDTLTSLILYGIVAPTPDARRPTPDARRPTPDAGRGATKGSAGGVSGPSAFGHRPDGASENRQVP